MEISFKFVGSPCIDCMLSIDSSDQTGEDNSTNDTK